VTRYVPQWIQAGDYPAAADRRLIGGIWPRASVSGMVVTPASAMTVNISAGSAAIPTSNNSGSLFCSSDATEQATLTPAPASGSNRIDLIVAQARANDVDGGANNDWLFAVVTGSAAASPVAPATPANAVAVAQIYVPGASVTVTAPNITDIRPQRLDRPWNCAWGFVAGVSLTSNVTGIAPAGRTTILTLPAFVPVANRIYRVTGYFSQVQQNTANAALIGYLTDGNNQVVQQGRFNAFVFGQSTPIALSRTFFTSLTNVAASGFLLQLSTSAGTADVTGSGTQPAQLVAEDLGPVPGSAGT